MSQIDLLQVQIGRETGSWGVSVAPTVKLMDVEDVTFTPMVDAEVLRPRVGSLSNSRLSVLKGVWGKWKLSGWLTYEDAPYLIETLFGVATPTGAGPYTRTYTPPATAALTPRRLTMRYGNDTDGVAQLDSCIAQTLKVSCEKQSAAKYELEGIANKSSMSGITLAALSDRTTTPITGNDFSIFVDPFGSTIGTTNFTALTWYGFDLTIESGRKEKTHMGNLNLGGYSQPAWKAKLNLNLEFNTTLTRPELYSQLALTNTTLDRLVRLGATQGASADLRFDFAGTATKAPELWKDQDGVASLEYEYEDKYNSVLAGFIAARSINSVATLA